MSYGNTTKEQVINFIKLLFPVLVYQMITYSSGMIGTFMTGQYSTRDLAGLSMGINIWNPIISVLNTLVVAIIPIISQLIGNGNHKEVPTKVRQFIYVSLILSFFISITLYFGVDIIIEKVGISSEISDITRKFLKYQSLGVMPIVLYVLLKSFIDSLGFTKLSMIMMFCYVPINILLSYLFIFGKFGFSEMGGVGVALSTNITYIISLLIAVIVIIKHSDIKKYKIFKFEKIKLRHWSEIFKIAIPMGIAVAIETFMFSFLSLMVSRFDTITIAAHQSSLNFAGFLYSLPMSISSALTIVVAYYVGAKNYKVANKFVKIGTVVSIIFSVIITLVILIFNTKIPYLYGSDAEFVNKVKYLLYYVIGFTFFDSFSACLIGVMRAYKKVIPTCLCMAVAYYLIGVPIAYYLVFIKELGVSGLWISWLVGIGVYSILMITYYLKIIRKVYV